MAQAPSSFQRELAALGAETRNDLLRQVTVWDALRHALGGAIASPKCGSAVCLQVHKSEMRALNKAMKERVATEAANRNVYEVARDTCKTPDGESPSGYKAEGSDIVPFKQWQKWYTEQSDGSTCVWQAWQKTAFEEQQAWQERLIAEDARMCNLNDL